MATSTAAPNSGDMGTLLGWTGLGFGVIILYGAVKGVSVFGKDGIITNAITEGKLTHVVAGTTTTSGGKATGASAAVNSVVQAQQGPAELNKAIGSGTKSVVNNLANKAGVGGFVRFEEGLPVIGRIVNDGGNWQQAASEIGGNLGRTVGHDIGGAAKAVGHAAGSYFSKLKGLL